MNKINEHQIDLNLLSVFVLLMQERSVTAVAERISRGQPAVSHALARLRNLINDPLFIRSGRHMEPTPRALSLYEEVEPAIRTLASAVSAAQPFDPNLTERVFRVAMSDDVQLAFLPQITDQMMRQMPRAKLIVAQTDYRQASKMLEQKQTSLVVGYLDRLPATAKIKKIRRVSYQVLASNTGCPDDQVTLDLEAYCARSHVLVTFAGDLVGYVDETLAKINKSRLIQVSVPAFAVLPYVMDGTKYLATVPQYVAEVLCQRHPLTALPLPFKSPEFDLSIAWNAVTDKDPAETLLREIIVKCLRPMITDDQR